MESLSSVGNNGAISNGAAWSAMAAVRQEREALAAIPDDEELSVV